MARPEWYATGVDEALNVAAPGVLSNDTDADGDPLAAVLAEDAGHGLLTLNADGSFDYVPDAGWEGFDRFLLKHLDDGGKVEQGPVVATVSESSRTSPQWKREAVKAAQALSEALDRPFDEERYLKQVTSQYSASVSRKAKLVLTAGL